MTDPHLLLSLGSLHPLVMGALIIALIACWASVYTFWTRGRRAVPAANLKLAERPTKDAQRAERVDHTPPEPDALTVYDGIARRRLSYAEAVIWHRRQMVYPDLTDQKIAYHRTQAMLNELRWRDHLNHEERLSAAQTAAEHRTAAP